jgi:hypothetical protein
MLRLWLPAQCGAAACRSAAPAIAPEKAFTISGSWNKFPPCRNIKELVALQHSNLQQMLGVPQQHQQSVHLE